MRKFSHLFLRIFLPVSCILLLSACGGKKLPPEAPAVPPSSTLADVRTFPQDLLVYAKQSGMNRRLMSSAEQQEQDSRFNRIFFGPWNMKKSSIRKKSVTALFRKARGYKDGHTRWTQAEWDSMKRNADLKHFPSRASAAITVRATNLRELPTHTPRFSEPTPDVRENPFDYFQYSALPAGTPLLIAHTSRDGRWHYVECPVAGGWVAANDVALTDSSFQEQWRSGKLAALIRDRVPLGQAGQGNIGTVLPLRGSSSAGLRLLIPTRMANGYAAISETVVSAQQATAKPLPMTAGNVANLGNLMLGQKYGWGGMLGLRDCSALTRELFTPFGIWLPRNSVAQARKGSVVSLTGLSAVAKEEAILREGVPFLSLVGMRGHIMLYVGKYKGRAAIFHNVWGVRTEEDGDDNARFVIGQAVITSITPGMELPNLYRETTFVDRLRTLSTPGGD